MALSLNKTAKKGFYNSQEIGLGRALGRLGHEVCIFKLISGKNLPSKKEERLSENVLYTRLPAGNIGSNGFFDKSFLPKDADLFICFSDTQLFTGSVYKWCRKNNICFIPYIGVLESVSTSAVKRTLMSIHNKRLIRIYRKCAQKAAVLCKTPEIVDACKSKGITNVILFPVGLDSDILNKDFRDIPRNELRKELGFDESGKIILFVGRLEEDKKPVQVVELFKQVFDKDSSAILCMIGRGSLENEVKTKIFELGLRENVKSVLSVPNIDIWKYYRIASSFINYCPNEIYGMAILEALYYECPVYAYLAPGPSFILGRTNLPDNICTDDPAELVKCMISGTGESSPEGEMTKAVMESFTWDMTLCNLSEILR